MSSDKDSGLFHPPSTIRMRAIDERVLALRSFNDPRLLRSVFQPIFRAGSGELEGAEALIRFPEDAGFKDPSEAFSLAAKFDLLPGLERAATARHLMDATPFKGKDLRLFLNVSAPIFSDAKLGADWLLDKCGEGGFAPSQIVLELTEILRIRDFASFGVFLEPFRRHGFQIAVDDFGAGYTNLRMITDLTPDFVKVDRVFVDGIASHARKRILVESVVTLCHRVNCVVIAEGVELPEDLETCLAAGVDYLQGFLFGRPTDADSAANAPALLLPGRPRGVETRDDLRRLLLVETPVSSDDALDSARLRFQVNTRLSFLPVVRGGRAAGLLSREDALRELPASGPTAEGAASPSSGLTVSDVTSSLEWDRIEERSRPEDAAALVRRRPEKRRFQPLVVVGPEQVYRGLLTVDILLDELARLNTDFQLQSNPITRLPGRLVFERTVGERLDRRLPFALARLNLRRFKLFNDRHGFLRGDDVLLFAASVLRDAVGSQPDAFVAHLSDDHFGLVAAVEGIQEAADTIVKNFDAGIGGLHEPEDAQAGSFPVRDRRGDERRVPLVGVSMGVAIWSGESVDARTLLETVEMTLNGTRGTATSSWLLNRRALPSATRLTSPGK